MTKVEKGVKLPGFKFVFAGLKACSTRTMLRSVGDNCDELRSSARTRRPGLRDSLSLRGSLAYAILYRTLMVMICAPETT